MQSDTVIASRKTVEIFEVNWKALADEVEKLAMAKLAEDLEDWRDDRGMRAMFLGDASDALEVCEVIVTGDCKAVEEKLWKMDTAAREYVYDWIERVAGVSFHKLAQYSS